MKLEISRQIFEKFSNIQFNENPSSGSRAVPSGQTDGKIDLTKLIVAFRNVSNAPKNIQLCFITGSILLVQRALRQTDVHSTSTFIWYVYWFRVDGSTVSRQHNQSPTVRRSETTAAINGVIGRSPKNICSPSVQTDFDSAIRSCSRIKLRLWSSSSNKMQKRDEFLGPYQNDSAAR